MAGFDDDDLSKDIESALTGESADANPPAPAGEAAPPSEPAPDKAGKVSEGGRPRDESGKFVAKTEAPPVAADVAKPVEQQPTVAPTQQQPPIAPPQAWKGNGKVEWNRLPRHVQQALADDYASLTKPQAELQTLKTAIGEDRLQALAANYGSAEQGLQRLFALSDFATKDRLGFLKWFAEQNRIDLRQLVQGAAQGEQPAGDPNPLMQEVLSLKSQLQQFQQQQQTQAQSQVVSQIDAFARDPSHPYFNDVREHMGALMKAGKAETLQEAYEMATWAHPEVRKSLLEQQTQQAMQSNAQKVQQAKQAGSGSLTGSPAGAKVPSDEPERSLEAEITRQVNAAFGT